MSLQDKVNAEKSGQSMMSQGGHTLNQVQPNEEIIELKKQNKLLRDRMIEIEKSQDKRNQKIDQLLSRLEKGTTDWNSNVSKATEKVSFDLLNTQEQAYQRIEENFKKQNNFAQKYKKIQLMTLTTLSIVAMLLFIALIARTLLLGVWEGLFLSQLWSLGEWYWSALTVVIIIALIGGVSYLVYRGICDIRGY